MTWRDQTFLGSTATKSLTLVRLNPRRPVFHIPSDTCFLLLLPDELLLSIVDYATRPRHAPTHACDACWNIHASLARSTNAIKVLSRVCHRLRQMAQPLLFHTIQFYYSHTIVPPTKAAHQLDRTLKHNPHLRQHCRALHIHIEDIYTPSPVWYSVANRLAQWLTNTRSLSIGGGFSTDRKNKEEYKQTWALIRKFVASCDAMEHLDLNGRDLYLVSIFRWINCPNLKSLKVSSLSEWPHGPMILAPHKRRTASFTSLTLSLCNERPEAIRELLQWPAALTHFTFGSFYESAHHLDYPMFTSWLSIHRETLTHVSIDELSFRGCNRLFNATLFPNLEFLQLSRWQMGTPLQFRIQDADDILGPRLKTFSWAFFLMSCYYEGVHFGGEEVSWVRQLVETAVSRKAALTTIEIAWPEELHYARQETGRPWELMFAMRDKVMTPNGIDLIYNAPTLSREDWESNRRMDHEACQAHIAATKDGRQFESEVEVEGEEKPELRWSGGYHGESIRPYLLPRLELTDAGAM